MLNCSGFPLFVIGITDLAKSCHYLRIALFEKKANFEFVFYALIKAYNKFDIKIVFDFLISDAASAIRGAFLKVFSQKKMVMCWARMFSNVLKHLNTISDKTDKFSLLNDIRSLLLCPSELVFNKASLLFVKKWEKKCLQFID